MNVTANFAINTYTLTYTAGANGTISGDQPADGQPRRQRHGGHGGARRRLSLRQLERRRLDRHPRTDTNVTANVSVTANFAINTYTLTYTAGANGTISGDQPADGEPRRQRHAGHGGAQRRYHFVSWSDGVTTATRTDTNVTANVNVTATFTLNTYVITPTAGANGGITPGTAQTVTYGFVHPLHHHTQHGVLGLRVCWSGWGV